MRKTVALVVVSCSVATILAAPAAGRQRKTPDSKPAHGVVIDINRAGAVDFEKLPGMGPELARRIITYRQKHGPFRRVEDLLAVHGMGEKKWRAIRPYLTVASARGKDGKIK
jgi:competence protein ComEA